MAWARAGSPRSASRAFASAAGSRGGTSTPVTPSSTTSGMAAAPQVTTASPAAMASRNTMPKLSCTEGRQKRSALTYSSASCPGETSPSSVTVSPRSRAWCRRRTVSHSGPLPTMRTARAGTRPRRRAAASSRSTMRLRGYMRATHRTVAPVRGRACAEAKRAELEGMTEPHEAPTETVGADEGPTPLQRIGWRGGEGGDAQTLRTGELRLPLFQERPRAFRVVVAVERLDPHLEELPAMGLAHALEDGLHLRLGSAAGQRRVLRHRAQVVVRARLEIVGGHETLDEADAEGLPRLEGAGG